MRNFRNLVFEGGGVKGIAYGGALEVLQQMGILEGISRVAGTSAGAINATLLALGYTPAEVSGIVANTDFSRFADSGIFVAGVTRLLRYYGWNKGDAFKEFISGKIENKTGNPDFTFADLQEAVRSKNTGFRSLYVVATNLTQQRFDVFSHETTPDQPVADAVRMSMSIPLYFKTVNRDGNIMADGGVTYNYPVNLFDHEKYLSNASNKAVDKDDQKPGYVFNYETLGFRLDSKNIIEYNRKGWKLPPVEIGNLKSFSFALMDFMMESANRAHLRTEDWNRTIFIDTLDVKTTDFKKVKRRINVLMESGRKGVREYFRWRDSDPVWGKVPA